MEVAGPAAQGFSALLLRADSVYRLSEPQGVLPSDRYQDLFQRGYAHLLARD